MCRCTVCQRRARCQPHVSLRSDRLPAPVVVRLASPGPGSFATRRGRRGRALEAGALDPAYCNRDERGAYRAPATVGDPMTWPRDGRLFARLERTSRRTRPDTNRTSIVNASSRARTVERPTSAVRWLCGASAAVVAETWGPIGAELASADADAATACALLFGWSRRNHAFSSAGTARTGPRGVPKW